jgi:hypothetical protein
MRPYVAGRARAAWGGVALPQQSRIGNLRAALGFLRLPPAEPELQLLHRWLDC